MRPEHGIDGVAAIACALLGILFCGSPAAGQDAAISPRYVLDYPVAKQFCLPVDSYADDVTQTTQRTGGRTIRHQPNGGYGLPVVMTIGDQHVLHLGVDVAWYRVGAPVYAIADGVVRLSQGATPPATDKKVANAASTQIAKGDSKKTVEIKDSQPAGDAPTEPAADATDTGNGVSKPATNNQAVPAALGWGNVVAIEHHLPDGSYVTSIYGHLGSARRVAAGDIVHAGQMIGTVGKSGTENGGYKPHLHFGLRAERMFEPGRAVMVVVLNGQADAIKIASMGEDEVELETPPDLPLPLELRFGERKFAIVERDHKSWMPTAVLNYLQSPEFPIVGYGLSTDGWLDPTEFLKQALSQYPKAPFGGGQQQAKTANSNR